MKKNVIESFDQFVSTYDRVFLSPSIFKNDLLTTKIIALFKQSKFRPHSFLINNQLAENKIFQNKFPELFNANLISLKMMHPNDNSILKPLQATYKEAANNILKYSNYKLLLITNDEIEATSYLNLIAEETHVTNINAIGFDQNCVPFEYQEELDYIVDTGVTVTEEEEVVGSLKYRGGERIPLEFYKDEAIKVIAPVTGGTIFTKNGDQIVIGKKLGDGGEGIVYSTNRPDEVVKILKPNANTKNKQKKLEQMVQITIDNELIVWPQDTVYASDGKFVGFTMKNVSGIDLKSFTFHKMPNAVLKPNEININFINKVDLCKLILSILDTILYLHQRNIVIGDIKLENFMIKDKDISNIYFVDCDSYQVGEFPAILVSPGFKPPEIDPSVTGRQNDKFRTFGNEYFAIFSLIFHLIFRAKSPYTQQNHTGKDIADWERAKSGEFPYFLDKEKTIKTAPRGTEEPIWGHLPGYIKKAFINVGHHSGNNFGEKKRLTPLEWQKIFTCYLEDLESGKLAAVDPKCNNYHFIGQVDNMPYSAVDIQMSREEVIALTGVTIDGTVRELFAKSDKSVQPAVIVNIIQALKNTTRYKDNYFEFNLKRNAGIFYDIEFTFVK
ncbi:MAG: hypothetical protein R3Y60_03070 [bacterium]